MHVLILGADGYIGWPLYHYLRNKGHKVLGFDSYSKRDWERQCGAKPIGGGHGTQIHASTLDAGRLYAVFESFQPDAVVHLAEQPSAPFSMIDRSHAQLTVDNNIKGTLNVAMACARQQRTTGQPVHLVKLGSMGEYGTPKIPIEEGWLEVEHKGYKDRVLFPKKPGSIYHATKVADSTFLEMFCRIWGLAVTDLNQGVVWGHETDECPWGEQNRRVAFHFDEIFGTVVNRFCVQRALDCPTSIYGSGRQTRGFLHLRDSLRCIELAVTNPVEAGEFRVFNQLWDTLSIQEIADMVGGERKLVPNPRVEDREHLYAVTREALPALGFVGTPMSAQGLEAITNDFSKLFESFPQEVRLRIQIQLGDPKTMWRQE